MRKSQRERLIEEKRKKMEPVQLDFAGLVKLLVDGGRRLEERQVNPTQLDFICDPAREKAYMGRAGAAKTTTLCASGWMRALLEPGSKGLVSRNDYNDLMDTTAGVMEKMLQRLPPGTLLDRDKSPPMKWWVRPIGTDADPSEITFMGLKDAVGSYEFNWVLIDEADEVDEKRVEELQGRLRHIRPGTEKEDNNYSISLAFNPPPKTHWLYKACTGRDFKDRKVAEALFKLFVPKMGENQRNLPDDYYEKMARGMSEEMRQRLVDGQWVEVFPGAPVYRQFKRSWHVRDDLRPLVGQPVIRFWDYGYRAPYCGFMQMDDVGRLHVLHEVQGENVEISAFARRVKAESNLAFSGHRHFIDYGDPAAAQKKDTGSTLAELLKEGITLRYRTSTIEQGLRLCRTELERVIEGYPSVMFSRHGCPILISALAGGYHMDEEGKRPVKDGYYDHSADAWRYGMLNILNGGGIVGALPQHHSALVTSVASWENP